ncbi:MULTISPECIES: DUF4083 family protein [unclassified Bacillus (in: firmicutes)]|uniref:DUF4083 family protein n=1 Tax=unclassified Bacillus (in: firmicutes) TaxID=185979 RepID=UPI001155FDCF|nr:MULTISPECIES: DUF4083 family protein [unclassified Bacillus (in: firmicutes)]
MPIGDLIYQLIVILIPIAIIIFCVFIFRFIRNHKLQMKRLEAKIDKINENYKNLK